MTAAGLAFVDTNILVYAFTPDDQLRNRPARALVESLMAQDRFCISTQVLQELYVTITRRLAVPATPDQALAYLDTLSVFRLCQTDYPMIREAIRLAATHSISFWDSLVLSAAIRLGATTLYTEDLNHGQTIQGVRIVNPFR